MSWTEALVEQAVRVREQCRPSRLCLTISLGSQPAWGAGIAGPLIGQPRLYRCITNDHKLSGLKLHKFIISLWVRSLAHFS